MDFNLFFSAISAIASAFIVIQLLLSFIQKRKEHEEQRRQKTVDMLLEWNRSLERETSSAVKIVGKFSEEQCRKLFRQEIFKVDKTIKKEICQLLQDESELACSGCDLYESSKDECYLSQRQLAELRWYIISYLNTLETVLVAWQQGTVDKKMLEREFSYMYNPENGVDVLSKFRSAAGGSKAYPVIEYFIFTLRKNEERKYKLRMKYDL